MSTVLEGGCRLIPFPVKPARLGAARGAITEEDAGPRLGEVGIEDLAQVIASTTKGVRPIRRAADVDEALDLLVSALQRKCADSSKALDSGDIRDLAAAIAARALKRIDDDAKP